MGTLGKTMPPQGGPQGDAKATLHRHRMLWTQHVQSDGIGATPVMTASVCQRGCADSYSSSDEGDEFTSQRYRIRNLSRHVESERQESGRSEGVPAAARVDTSVNSCDTICMQKNKHGIEANPESPDDLDFKDVGGRPDQVTQMPRKDHHTIARASLHTLCRSHAHSPPRQAHHLSRPRPPDSQRTQQSQSYDPALALQRFRVIIIIQDYDFDRRNVIVPAQAPVEFRLQDDVPLHVEHVLEGRSVCTELCFTSPILQLPLSRRYEFVPPGPGEIFVSCQIYPDMGCRIVVMPSPPVPRSALSAVQWAPSTSQRKKQTSIPSPLRVGSASSSTALARLNGSFPLSQRHTRQSSMDSFSPSGSGNTVSLSKCSPKGQSPLVAQCMLMQGVLGMAERTWLGKTLSASSLGELSDTLSSSVMDSDDGPDDFSSYTDMLLTQPLGNQASTSGLSLLRLEGSEEDDYMDSLPGVYGYGKHDLYGSACGHFEEMDTPDFTVRVEDFKFSPSQVDIPVGSSVKFQSVSHASMHKLTCVGAFDGMALECSEDSFTFTFDNTGEFVVKNEIFSFMACVVSVRPVEETEQSVESASDLDESRDHSPTVICTIGHSEYDPLQASWDTVDDDVRKYYDHMDGTGRGAGEETGDQIDPVDVLPVSPSGSAVSGCLPENEVQASPLSTGKGTCSASEASPGRQEQLFLMASVDWGLTADDMSDEEVEREDAARQDEGGDRSTVAETEVVRSDDVRAGDRVIKKKKRPRKKKHRIAASGKARDISADTELDIEHTDDRDDHKRCLTASMTKTGGSASTVLNTPEVLTLKEEVSASFTPVVLLSDMADVATANTRQRVDDGDAEGEGRQAGGVPQVEAAVSMQADVVQRVEKRQGKESDRKNGRTMRVDKGESKVSATAHAESVGMVTPTTSGRKKRKPAEHTSSAPVVVRERSPQGAVPPITTADTTKDTSSARKDSSLRSRDISSARKDTSAAGMDTSSLRKDTPAAGMDTSSLRKDTPAASAVSIAHPNCTGVTYTARNAPDPSPPEGRGTAFLTHADVKPSNLFNMLQSASAVLRAKEGSGRKEEQQAGRRPAIPMGASDDKVPVPTTSGTTSGMTARCGEKTLGAVGLLSEEQRAAEKDVEEFFCQRKSVHSQIHRF